MGSCRHEGIGPSISVVLDSGPASLGGLGDLNHPAQIALCEAVLPALEAPDIVVPGQPLYGTNRLAGQFGNLVGIVGRLKINRLVYTHRSSAPFHPVPSRVKEANSAVTKYTCTAPNLTPRMPRAR